MLRDRIASVFARWVSLLLLASCGGGGEAPGPAEPAQAQGLASTMAAPIRTDNTTARGTSGGPKRNYIVQLAEPPVAAYEGGIAGHGGTRPTPGEKVDASLSTVGRYRSHLLARQDAELATVGNARKLHSYAYVFNGFAAELTEAQAQKLALSAGVLSVTKDQRRRLSTSSTPAFLGLSGQEGFWRETGARGEDIVIGILDSGIWPEHPSFSDRTPWGDRAYGRPRGWKGSCSAGIQFAASDCNRKLIGARYYNAGFGGDEGVLEQFPDEFISPRDYDGHGTHVASTAGGNAGVPATGLASFMGKISGMAPRARIAAYKVCWGTAEAGSCWDSDAIAAIDQAIEDGVDVINFSIAGYIEEFLNPVALAFLRAADAGVFVAAAASNEGPAAGSVQNKSPWITTVAAGTHNRKGEGSVTLGNGARYAGGSLAQALPSSPLIDATAAAAAGADPDKAAWCFSAADNGGQAVLDRARVAGKVVVCDRGVVDRIAKSKAVFEAGGVGMLLLNTDDAPIVADLHAVPTVHLPAADRAAVKAYAGGAGATAAIAQSTLNFTTPAPFTAEFSSRGPTQGDRGDVLKPDILAPGRDVLAGMAPPRYGRLFDLLSGTSMASPHVAGVGALMKELHPKWSPMAIKSALMTTAQDVRDGPNTDARVIFSQGAGHIHPSSAAEPGLVFDSRDKDWLGFLCGTELPASVCTNAGVRVLAPSDLNMASIAVGAMTGTQTVTRRVTNVDGGFATYTPSHTGMVGVDVAIVPRSLTLAPGQTKSFRVTFKRTSAAVNAFVGGQLTWTGGTSRKAYDPHRVRVPMVVRPVALLAPAEVGGSYGIRFGYTGPFTATARGLTPAKIAASAIAAGAVVDIPVSVAAGSTYARFSLFDSDVSQAGTDLDLEVYGPTGELVGSSAGPSAAEEISVVGPQAGTYTVRVYGFAVPAGSSPVKLFAWVLGSSGNGSMVVTAPSTAITAGAAQIDLSFSGLVPGMKYLGAVVYGGEAASTAPTIVRVDR